MTPRLLRRLPSRWQAWMMKVAFNVHPAFRASGGRVVYVAPDLAHIRVSLSLGWRTRNVVGSLYGGSLFAMTDGPHPAMLMAALGDGVIVWDKAATIRYRRPGFGTVFADFRVPSLEVELIRHELARNGEVERTYPVEIKGDDGTVHALVERTVYIAAKDHYRRKKAEQTSGDKAA